ncbi:MAG: PD-(D/E)XK nuclease family protein [Myxococcota bacterium]
MVSSQARLFASFRLPPLELMDRYFDSSAAERIQRVADWLAGRSRRERLLFLCPSPAAGAAVLRRFGRPSFCWERLALPALAARIAAPVLAAEAKVAGSPLAKEALALRAVHELPSSALGRYADVARRPGFGRALVRTEQELALQDVSLERVAEVNADLAGLLRAFRRQLEDARVSTRAEVFHTAIRRIETGSPDSLIGCPTAVLDIPQETALDRKLVAAVTEASVEAIVVGPASGDDESGAAPPAAIDPGLRRLQRRLFAPERIEASSSSEAVSSEAVSPAAAPSAAASSEAVEVFSAPGENRECVEIARRVLRLAADSDRPIPFDEIAIVLRAPEHYRAPVGEALRRAGIEAHYTRGTLRPNPSGRALLALLRCRREDLSARAFAEFLSLNRVARRPSDPEEVGTDHDLMARPADPIEEDEVPEPLPPMPRRWERLLVDAAVIGGRDRWVRRLRGLRNSLRAERMAAKDPDDPRVARLDERMAELDNLEATALPILDALQAMPEEANWSEWLDQLKRLAGAAIHQPEGVLRVLSELSPLGPVGPVSLRQVEQVLRHRLTQLVTPPAANRSGRVFVCSIDEVRGLSFRAVFVPGVAEKMFPQKVSEDPLLLDADRRAIGSLPTNVDRVRAERLLLRIAVGAARERLVVSFPRIDGSRGRPRVPSFYGLELTRAYTGELPGFRTFSQRADQRSGARLGWPAPRRPEEAIDASEFDLAMLHRAMAPAEGAQVKGAARYLLSADDCLARSLRRRGRRWGLRGWKGVDGLIAPDHPEVRGLLAAEVPSARPYSPTALEAFSACPYRFYLRSILRLSPRFVPEAIDELDPLERGRLIHDIQRVFLDALRTEGELPVTRANHRRVVVRLREVVREVSARHREELHPAIGQVWDDAIGELRGDLEEWLLSFSERALSEHALSEEALSEHALSEHALSEHAVWVPRYFELAFGLDRADRDPASVDAPVVLDEGLTLRGSIDLVELHGNACRAIDHKTGRAPAKLDGISKGGTRLQPVLYALALEKIFPEREVTEGRLHFCTGRGGFQELSVPLGPQGRAIVGQLATTVQTFVGEAFLPAAPAVDACTHCDYRPICGPDEEYRTRRKDKKPLSLLTALRKAP